ncbi:MAG TPA: Uma2 family endonuclease [Spirochaetota bacterium]|nr:Uma2 family endonuclease [Spirochaetota bacterium]
MSNLALKPEQKYTYADYKTWNDGERYEIINGIIYNMSPAPMRVHQKISVELTRQISNYLKGKPCLVYDAPFDVRFIDYDEQSDEEIETVVQPDIVVVCDEKKLDDYGCKGAPDIVIEILSPSTYKKDKFEKFSLYEKYGVKEYWIVYPGEKIVEIYKLIDGKYGIPEVYGMDDKIEVKYLGELVVDLKEAF